MSMPLIEAARHRLTVQLPSAPVVLHIDRHRIAQVLSNLINNAAKYTPACGHIDVAAHRQQRELAITVTDNGIGIDEKLLPVVFDMYAQAPAGQGMAQGGLGVGLNLVRRLVQLHDGRVSAESGGTDQGSRFTVWLPLPLQGEEQAPPQDAAAAPAAPAPGQRALRILVVDDNVDAADVLAALLEYAGHEVTVVQDGASALASVAADPPQVVFLDIGLPDMSGYDAAPIVRNMQGMGDSTLVALTGWGAESDKLRSTAAGFDHHLTKPADFAQVSALLDAVAARLG